MNDASPRELGGFQGSSRGCQDQQCVARHRSERSNSLTVLTKSLTHGPFSCSSVAMQSTCRRSSRQASDSKTLAKKTDAERLPREAPTRALDVGPALSCSSCTMIALCRLARPRRRYVRCERPKCTWARRSRFSPAARVSAARDPPPVSTESRRPGRRPAALRGSVSST